MTLTNVRSWTVEEYYQMLDAGILTTEDRVELLEGQIIDMSPLHPPHAATTQRVSDYLRSLLTGKAMIRVQLPIALSFKSEPQPDIAVVRIDERDYFSHHPTAQEVFCLIEVSDATLNYDKTRKSSIYAQAKIPEYGVLDVNNPSLHLFREPVGNKYQQKTILTGDDTLSLLAFPDIIIQLSRLFP